MARPPKENSATQLELFKADENFKTFDDSVKEMTFDRLNDTKKPEIEEQTKLSQRDIERSKDVYLKPKTTIGCRDKFNERFRDEHNFQKEYVHFIAENHEILGENIEIWTRPFGGMPAEFWQVPVNKPIWGPRYLAEQIKRKFYHRLVMKEDVITSSDGKSSYYGQMAADTTIPRLDARPVISQKSVFMSAGF